MPTQDASEACEICTSQRAVDAYALSVHERATRRMPTQDASEACEMCISQRAVDAYALSVHERAIRRMPTQDASEACEICTTMRADDAQPLHAHYPANRVRRDLGRIASRVEHSTPRVDADELDPTHVNACLGMPQRASRSPNVAPRSQARRAALRTCASSRCDRATAPWLATRTDARASPRGVRRDFASNANTVCWISIRRMPTPYTSEAREICTSQRAVDQSV